MSMIDVQVEPSTKLYPAVFVEPTVKEVLQFELGRIKVTLKKERLNKFVILIQTILIELFTINGCLVSQFESGGTLSTSITITIKSSVTNSLSLVTCTQC